MCRPAKHISRASTVRILRKESTHLAILILTAALLAARGSAQATLPDLNGRNL